MNARTGLVRKVGQKTAMRRRQARLTRLKAKGSFRGGYTPPQTSSRKAPKSGRKIFRGGSTPPRTRSSGLISPDSPTPTFAAGAIATGGRGTSKLAIAGLLILTAGAVCGLVSII